MTKRDLVVDVLFLGSPHLDNPGRDVINVRVDDVLAGHRQEELDELATRLARFEPTKVCVEVDPSRQKKIDEEYQAYLTEGELPSKSEHHQVAFRVARERNLLSVLAIDHMSPINWPALEALMESNSDDARRFEEMLEIEKSLAEKLSTSIPQKPFRDIYLYLNSDEEMARDLGFYMVLAAMGKLEEFGGAQVAADWYYRNLMIFSNLAAVTEPGDRTFVVYGAGHVPILRHFVETAPGFRLIDVRPFLR